MRGQILQESPKLFFMSRPQGKRLEQRDEINVAFGEKLITQRKVCQPSLMHKASCSISIVHGRSKDLIFCKLCVFMSNRLVLIEQNEGTENLNVFTSHHLCEVYT